MAGGGGFGELEQRMGTGHIPSSQSTAERSSAHLVNVNGVLPGGCDTVVALPNTTEEGQTIIEEQ